MKFRRIVTALALLAVVLGPLAALATAQTAEIPRRTVERTWDSGMHNGNKARGGRDESGQLVASKIIAEPGVPWLQLQFGKGRLGRQSRIEITSLYDGATQVLDARSFEQWNNQSAYFNGDAVEVRVLVGPQDRAVRVQLKSLVVGEWGPPGTKSICGSDNRIASSETRVARIDPIGCTGWNISNGKQLTAGHCLAGSGNTTLSFEPPASLSDGTVQFPGPDKQYAINQGSFQFTNGGVGNDWGVFSVANNSQTGLQPMAAQGSFNFVQNLGPSTIRITGFGVDSGTTNQTNQTHTGPNSGSSGTTMRYAVDTMGGNSGSPVIDTATGNAVGIHTHGGCTSSGGSNSGTSFFNSAAWTAINSGSPPPPPPPTGGTLSNGVPVTGLSAGSKVNLNYTMEVPAGSTNLVFTTTGSDPDADLYVRFGAAPTLSTFDCRSWTSTSNETCNIGSAQGGTYHVMVHAWSAFSGLTLEGSFSGGSSPNSCVGNCGSQAPGGCWCDSQCASFGDCCSDKVAVCGP